MTSSRIEMVARGSAARVPDQAVTPRPADEDERELIRAARAGDRSARERLIEAFLPLISSTARVYRGSRRIERLELLQEGVVGLLRALERYDPKRGVPFWAYASWWVRQAGRRASVPHAHGGPQPVAVELHGPTPRPTIKRPPRRSLCPLAAGFFFPKA